MGGQLRVESGQRAGGLAKLTLVALLTALLGVAPVAGTPAPARQLEPDYSPAGGHSAVIAQGVVELPGEEVVWRTVRQRAEVPADAPFAERPLGFVLASTAPILLVDQATADATRLGPGEAALVRAGTVQQRASLGERAASFLAVELVPAAGAENGADGLVLQAGQPFVPTPGLHDLDLVRDVLSGDDVLTIPDTGQPNVILPTAGSIGVARPGGEPQPLLAGEAATFAGALEVGVAATGDEPSAEDRAEVVVAVIGPAVDPALLPTPADPPSSAEQPDPVTSDPATPDPVPPDLVPPAVDGEPPTDDESAADEPSADDEPADGGTTATGSITLQVLNCPPGMDAATLAAAVCTPAADDFDLTLAGDALGTTLTLVDATVDNGSYAWTNLPLGEYLLAEAVLPTGYESYVLSARGATGGPDTGYTLTLDAETPDQVVRVYNFAPDPSD